MTIETLRSTPHAQRAVAPVSPVRRPTPGAQMCIVVNELPEGGGTTLVENLGRRGSTRVILLARQAARRDLVQLLAGGLRGGVTADPRRLQAALAQRAARSPEPGVPTTSQHDPQPQPEPAPAPVRELPDLTARELGVLELVAAGRTNRMIGEELGLSALTVKSHLARISRKLGTGDRAELVAIVIRAGRIA
ncbi:LuxR C-terminal-related transcriptional regulator [Cellulomonas sp. ATA003]|uniref:helix-turn-helix transcriptional regulator n=1 Tax=Cellulomonas sp. ATA003 TaxID=3073064 RepID=UPI0028730093|nr:LuxR C-terminal-related transcriptional regulator [Cellulomonas sp. ATA003]WNB84415.1 LuxR C-terminal-related transcriptional regulator [Cellulomonas sp. ATA003]